MNSTSFGDFMTVGGFIQKTAPETIVMVLGLTPRGVTPVGRLITNDVAWRWVVSPFVRALSCRVPQMAKMLLGEWFYHRA